MKILTANELKNVTGGGFWDDWFDRWKPTPIPRPIDPWVPCYPCPPGTNCPNVVCPNPY